jgi:hypothetical protein
MQHEFDSGSQGRKEFVNKVAEKLGVPPTKVAEAVREARKERAERWVTERIQQSVQNGVITQIEADEILGWWRSRPDAVKKLWLGRMRAGRLGRCGIEGIQR